MRPAVRPGGLPRALVRMAALVALGVGAARAEAPPTLTLEHREWAMIATPVDTGDATVRELFGDDGLPTGEGEYGTVWGLFRTVPPEGGPVDYELVPPGDRLEPGVGYWMIQATGAPVTIDVPAPAAPDGPANAIAGCPRIAGCTEAPLAVSEEEVGGHRWNLIGLARGTGTPLARTSVVTDAGPCLHGCDFAAARAANVMHDALWRYVDGGYEEISQSETLEPWQAAWVPALPGAAGVRARLSVEGEGPDDRPDLAGGYTLAFSEEFDGPELDGGKWNTGLLWGPYVTINAEEQLYVDTLGIHAGGAHDPFVFTDQGTMKIVASRVGEGVALPERPGPDDPVWGPGPERELEYRYNEDWDASKVNYLSGIFTSYEAFRFAHGYVEIRAKVPTGPGLWPAFWLLPSQYVEIVPEIDVMEHLGQNAREVYHTYHFFDRSDPDNDWQARRTPTYETAGVDFSKDFHTYGVAWEPGQLVYYVDGVEVRRVRDGDPSTAGSPIALPRQAMYLIANLAVGGTWPGAPTAETVFPAEYEIDWIRAWKRDMPVPVDLDEYELVFGDEFDGDALDESKWNTKFIWDQFLPINCEEQYYVDVFGIDRDSGHSPFEVGEGTLTITAAESGTLTPANVPAALPYPTRDRIDEDADGDGEPDLPPDVRARATRYWNAVDQCQVSDGWAEKYGSTTYDPRKHTSGLITSYDAFKFIEGYAEIRARVPAGDGLWPAFWLLNGYYVRRNPEIDVMEILGERPDRLHTSYHRIGASRKMESQSSTVDRGDPGVGLADGFHTYAVQWDRGRIVWYLDGEEIWRVEEERVSDQLMYVIANLAVGGNFNTRAVDDAALPAELEIDHVRVYQARPTP